MQTLEIITQGNGAILVDLFEAIARIRKGGFINEILIASMLCGFVLLMMQNLTVFNAREIAKWTVAWTLIFGLIYQPTAEVVISDRILGGQVPVQNVPLGLAVFASTVSQMGTNLAEIFEDQLQIPNEVNYYTRTGTLMASKLALASSDMHIITPHLEKSFKNFAFQCVMYDVRIGARYTMDDLLYSTDLWNLIKQNTSQVRMFEYYGDKGQSEILVCKEGAIRLEDDLTKEAKNNAKILTWNLLNVNKSSSDNTFDAGNLSRIDKVIKDYLPASHQILVHMSGETTEILKRHMVMNAIRESAIKNAQMLDVGAGAQGYAIARAKLQQQNTFQLLGVMAGTGVQYLMNLFEALFYGSFILVVLISMMPGGHRVLLSYVTSLVWIQSWPTIYTIINFFMVSNATSANHAAASYIAPNGSEGIGWNLFTSPAIIQANLDQAALAGFYSLSVPFIAIAVVKGIGSFVHLAGHLGSISQGAASHAGEEMTTGNYSLENVSYLNTSSYNMNANHWDSAPSYRARNSSFEMDSGSQIRVAADGAMMLDQSQGMSNLMSNLHLGQSFASRRNDMYQEVQNAYLQAGQSYSESIGATMSSILQSSTSGGHSVSDGQNYSHSEQVGQSESIQQFEQLSEKLALHMGWSKDDSRNVLIGGSLGIGKAGIGKITKDGSRLFKGLRFEGSAGGSYGQTWLTREARDKVDDFIQSENASETIDRAIRATKDYQFHAGQDKQDKLSNDLASNLSNMRNHEEQFSTSQQQMVAAQQSYEYSESNAANVDHNLNQDFVEWLSHLRDKNGDEFGMEGVDNLLRNTDSAELYTQRYLDEKIDELRNQINPNSRSISSHFRQYSQEIPNDVQNAAKQNEKQVIQSAKTRGLQPIQEMKFNDSPTEKFIELSEKHDNRSTDVKDHMAGNTRRISRKVNKKIPDKSSKEPV